MHHALAATLACCVCLLGLCPPAAAQDLDFPDPRPPLEELIERLDAPVLAAREQATRDLLNRRDLELAEVEALQRRPDLSPEQWLRLERVALGLFDRGPRAALGIQFSPDGGPGSRIIALVDGFAAARLLQVGDLILRVDGMPVTGQAVLRAAILSHAPGETLALTIDRAGERLDLDIPLGSFANLGPAASPRPSDLLAAWSLRRARSGESLVSDPVVPSPGAEAADSPERGSPAWEALYARGDGADGLVVGGQPRESADLSLTRLAALDASRLITLDDLEFAGDADLALQIGLLRNRRSQVLDDIERFEGIIERGNLDAGGRVMMRQRLEQQRDQLAAIEEQIRLLDATRRDR